ncbi:probable G-protein coupled receptor 101 [Hyla sarda]|uniref:probable G-protein coupled receptor 101 n=1 Tax=Hyla sarda TaxID=327740 RepID=UPI0024C323B8|nr:probable G-protein coupled receptor 101 [Hyla sarda]XP_056395768.1 probable G-protein coupled receptor 101 [Hyla sarda]
MQRLGDRRATGNQSNFSAEQGPLSMPDTVLRIALIISLLCLSLFGNIMLLVVFHRKPQLLQVANRFIFNLLVADLLQTVLVMPCVIVTSLPDIWPLEHGLCGAVVVLMHLFAFAGVNTITVVSVDKYLAIIHPLSYPTKMTPKRGSLLIFFTWILSVLQSTPPLYGWGKVEFDLQSHYCKVLWASSYSYTMLSALFSFILPVSIMLACYGMVFRAARRQNALVHPVQANGCDRSDGTRSSALNALDKTSHHRPLYHCKAAKVIFAILSSYIISMGPYSVLSIISSCAGTIIPKWVTSIVLVLFFLQCCIHPYIYGYMHKSLKKEFLLLLHGFFCKQVHPQNAIVDSYIILTDGRIFQSHFSTGPTVKFLEEETTISVITGKSLNNLKIKDSRKESSSANISPEKQSIQQKTDPDLPQLISC